MAHGSHILPLTKIDVEPFVKLEHDGAFPNIRSIKETSTYGFDNHVFMVH